MTNKRTVLIVDDSTINRLLLHKILEEQYNLLDAENGQAALEILREKKSAISAVLLDVVMPVMDGFAFLQQYSQEESIRQVPVLITTHLDQDEVELKALSLGAVDFISKPFNHSILVKRLENTIRMREITTFVDAIERDALTNLYNKQAFYQRSTLAMRENPQMEYDLLAVDIERFKLVNDIYGIKEGDRLLRYLADFLVEFTKADNVLCGRISGDKFVLLLPRHCHYENRIVYHTRKALDNYHLKINLQVQYGLYHILDGEIPISTMCDRAQMAITSIKGVYGSQLALYQDSIIDSLRKEQTIVDEMGDALENGEFHVYYQAKYSLVEEEICGAEALARWVHKDKGILPPDTFIPVFEKNGFITTMDAYIWEETCKFIRKRMDQGKTIFPISVNVSRVDILNPKVVEVLTGLVTKYRLPPEYLHLEITETSYAENEEIVSKVVGQLKALGFYIEMDDFGSRYSSLNMLSQVNVDIIKLDIRFLTDVEQDGKSRRILTFIIDLVKWLGLTVVAEGVETQEQATFLKGISCDFAQGYYFARPMAEDKFEELLDGDVLKNLTLPQEQDGQEYASHSWYDSVGSSVVFRDHADALGLYQWDGKSLFMLRGNKEYYRLQWESTFSRMDLLAMMHQKSREKLYHTLEETNPYQHTSTAELCLIEGQSFKEERWLEVHIKLVESMENKKLFLFSFRDVTHYKKKNLYLQKRSTMLQILLDRVEEAAVAFVCNQRMQCIALNVAAVKLLESGSKEEVMAHATYNRILSTCCGGDLIAKIQESDWENGELKDISTPLELPRKDGSVLKGRLHIHGEIVQGERIMFLYVHDIVEER